MQWTLELIRIFYLLKFSCWNRLAQIRRNFQQNSALESIVWNRLYGFKYWWWSVSFKWCESLSAQLECFFFFAGRNLGLLTHKYSRMAPVVYFHLMNIYFCHFLFASRSWNLQKIIIVIFETWVFSDRRQFLFIGEKRFRRILFVAAFHCMKCCLWRDWKFHIIHSIHWVEIVLSDLWKCHGFKESNLCVIVPQYVLGPSARIYSWWYSFELIHLNCSTRFHFYRTYCLKFRIVGRYLRHKNTEKKTECR